jgi:uncharacterized protein YyaL (SSP411 family)
MKSENNRHTGHCPAETGTNRLINEKSPYLLQHAHNPVDWYPWGDEAFEKARLEDKPVFLSIGYSTCHWCHVMEEESFNDPEVAEILNKCFVCVKVDREERPDIDNVYMSVCQMMTGNGGWPLSIVMTWDKKPFFAATYIPKDSRYGIVGLIELGTKIREFWDSSRNDLIKSADQITEVLQQAAATVPQEAVTDNALDFGFSQLAQNYDDTNGGFGQPMKFPTPHNLQFLLRYWQRTKNEKALEMVTHTLTSIRRGGIYDQLGFGVHRYATDLQWLVPHFEKMLYDQAMLALTYTEAFQATGNAEFAATAHELLNYILTNLADSNGGFYSAQDADTNGEEGKFYLWTLAEIHKILDQKQFAIAEKAFDLDKAGNYIDHITGDRLGLNIIHQAKTIDELSIIFKLSPSKIRDQLDSIRKKLLAARNKRQHPDMDKKILTDWNSLTIVSLAVASRVFDNPEYRQAAVNCFDFIKNNLFAKDGSLFHRFFDHNAGMSGNLNDYATLAWASIELYETTFEPKYLRSAIELTDNMIERFRDNEIGGFFLTSETTNDLPLRPKEFYDGSTPAGNSVAACNLRKLAHLTGNDKYENEARSIEQSTAAILKQAPSAFAHLLMAIELGLATAGEVVIVGDSSAEDTKRIIHILHTRYLPHTVILLRPTEEKSPEILRLAPHIKNLTSKNHHAVAYVCHNRSCHPPTSNIDEILALLQESYTPTTIT